MSKSQSIGITGPIVDNFFMGNSACGVANKKQTFIASANHFLRVLVICCVRFCLAGLLVGCKETNSELALNDRTPQPDEQAYFDPLSPPSREGMTPAQIRFWEYLDQFNRLPDNPSEEAVAIYHAKGIAPKFKYLEPSKQSVLGDIEGLKRHRELFPTRYPWVPPLLRTYGLEIPISTGRFKGTAKEIGTKYDALMETLWDCKASDLLKKQFVANVLEGLLVLDYVYARGTVGDRRVAHEIWLGVILGNETAVKYGCEFY